MIALVINLLSDIINEHNLKKGQINIYKGF